MEVIIRDEHGWNLALYGFSLAFMDNQTEPENWWNFEEVNITKKTSKRVLANQKRMERIFKTAVSNSPRDKGHNKFLRQISVWVDIKAPRAFWSEFDTYKVGTVASSTSTMHTLHKRDMEPNDLEASEHNQFYKDLQIDAFNKFKSRGVGDIQDLKELVPDGFLQRRLVLLNYAVLREMIRQRCEHRLRSWQTFIDQVYKQIERPYLLQPIEGDKP